ncbi:MAG: RNase P modulator RnpM [Anaerolineae bacterium]|jgi:predicted RNA-binding protein YlxR (DUF448 family)|nr:YlxR family protein [Chloroflexota bacterium]
MLRKKPQRTCVGCRSTTSKRELVRLVRTAEGRIEIDPTGKRAGRGAYLHANRACWRRALDQKLLARALKMTICEEDAAALRAHAETLPEAEPETVDDVA